MDNHFILHLSGSLEFDFYAAAVTAAWIASDLTP